MRIAHTSDWHAGRIWKNVSRIDELASVLDNLRSTLEGEKIDVLLVTGDVFDSGAPSAEAERHVFRFFRRVGEAGIQTVVIAGNHDNPSRIEAWGTLTELVKVYAVARPARPDKGGVLELQVGRERAVIAALPFAPVSRLVSALDLAESDTRAQQRYADGMARMVSVLAGKFDAAAVNLLMMHTYIDGAVLSAGPERSERLVHLGEEWAATPQSLPQTAHYVALGHIHKPQQVGSAPVPTYYAGSPLQLDFGEEGEEKSLVVLDARPRQPASIERIPYRGAKMLRTIRASLEEIERDAAQLADAGWLRIRVPLAVPDPEINAKVRRVVGSNVVSVVAEVPEQEARSASSISTRGLTPAELFRGYFEAEHKHDVPEKLLDRFERLREAAEEA